MSKRIKSTGYYCTVCEESFNPESEDLEDIRNDYSGSKVDTKIEEAWTEARELFIDHWEDNHW